MRGRTRRGWTTAAVVVAVAITGSVLAGCSANSGSNASGGGEGNSQSSVDPKPGGSIVYGIAGESTGWSPQTDRWGPGPINVARAVYDPLVMTGVDGNIHPWLAESFVPKDNNKTWLIRIRKDIKFHNGEPVDGHAVVYNLQAYKKSALTAFAFQPVVDIQKEDDYTVKVTLDQEWGNFPSLFSGQAGFIVAPEMIRDNLHDKAIGSGPFVFKEWQRDRQLVVTKNADYWRSDSKGRKLPYLDSVTFRPIPDENNRKSSLSSGDLDIIHTNSTRGVAEIAKNGMPEGQKVLMDESEGDEMNVVFNTQTLPGSDENFRKALQLATDRNAIASQYEGAVKIADGPFSDRSQWHSDAGWPAPDQAKAKELLARYQADHPGPLAITLSTIATPDGLEIGQLLQSQWAAVGVETRIESQDETKFSQTLVGGTHQAIVFQYWNGDDPDVNFHFWTGKNIGPAGSISLNFPRWTSEGADNALNAGRKDTDPSDRKKDYAGLWKEWADHAPYLFIYHGLWAVAYRDTVHGIDDVTIPGSREKAQPIVWGTIVLSNTWTDH